MKTNTELQKIITTLKKTSQVERVPLWKRIATDLEKPTRQRRLVNLYKIAKHARDGETIVVPGKVLGVGALSKKTTVAAFTFSKKAKDAINKQGNAITILELVNKNPKGKKVRILG